MQRHDVLTVLTVRVGIQRIADRVIHTGGVNDRVIEEDRITHRDMYISVLVQRVSRENQPVYDAVADVTAIVVPTVVVCIVEY